MEPEKLSQGQQSNDAEGKTPHHYLTFFGELENSDGGMKTVFFNEAHRQPENLTFISCDKKPMTFEGVPVVPADPMIADVDPRFDPEVDGLPNLFMAQFGCGDWQQEFPRCHTVTPRGLCPPELVEEMYQAMESAHDFGSFEFMLEYIDQFGRGNEPTRRFAKRFERALLSIDTSDGKEHIANLQGAWFIPFINESAEKLHAKGIKVTLHHHGNVPEDEYLGSPWALSLLEACTKVDAVFVHTNVFKERLERRLAAMGAEVPTIEVFNLGIDAAWPLLALNRINKTNFDQVPEWQLLDDEQRALIAEKVKSSVRDPEHYVPHQFSIPERICTTKNTFNVYKGIELFLDQRERAGFNPSDEYRFFLLHDFWKIDDFKPEDIKGQYILACKKLLSRIRFKHPGVIHVCDSLRGPVRDFLPMVEEDTTVIMGGAEEGFGLAGAEGAAINANFNHGIIAGKGSGFAMAAVEKGLERCAYFVNEQSPDDYALALNSMVELRSRAPEALLASNSRLVRDFISERRDGLAKLV